MMIENEELLKLSDIISKTPVYDGDLSDFKNSPPLFLTQNFS